MASFIILNPDGSETVVDIPEPTPVLNHHITKRAFRNRFTQAEEISIEIAQLDNPNAPMTDRAKAAALRAAQRKVSDSPYVDLKLDQTIQGVQMLEAVGLLATGRANAILNNPISDEERYKE